MNKELTIQYMGDNDYTVRMGDQFTAGLTWDEMLGQVAYITCPKGEGWGIPFFNLLTQEEWNERYPWKAAVERDDNRAEL